MSDLLFKVCLILLLTGEVFCADTTVCPVGFSITRAHMCDVVLGPCRTTNYDASVPTFATTCLTCFDDAELFTVYRFNLFVTSCVPKVCTLVHDFQSAQPGMCQSCMTGYTLTANRSCVLSPAITTTTTTNTTNTTAPTTPTPTNATNITTPTTTPTNATTPTTTNTTTTPTTTPTITPTTTPTTTPSSSSNLSNSPSNYQEFVTSSIILSGGAVLCMLMWIAFKLLEHLRLRPNQQRVLPDQDPRQEDLKETVKDDLKEERETRPLKNRRRQAKDSSYDQQQLTFTEMDEIAQ